MTVRTVTRTETRTVTVTRRLCACGNMIRYSGDDRCSPCTDRAGALVPDKGMRDRRSRLKHDVPKLRDYEHRPAGHVDLLERRCTPIPQMVDGTHRLRPDQAAALCGPCPFREECLRIGAALSRAGQAGGTFGGHHFPARLR